MKSHLCNPSAKYEYPSPVIAPDQDDEISGFLNHNLPIHYATYVGYDDDHGPFTLEIFTIRWFSIRYLHGLVTSTFFATPPASLKIPTFQVS